MKQKLKLIAVLFSIIALSNQMALHSIMKKLSPKSNSKKITKKRKITKRHGKKIIRKTVRIKKHLKGKNKNFSRIIKQAFNEQMNPEEINKQFSQIFTNHETYKMSEQEQLIQQMENLLNQVLTSKSSSVNLNDLDFGHASNLETHQIFQFLNKFLNDEDFDKVIGKSTIEIIIDNEKIQTVKSVTKRQIQQIIANLDMLIDKYDYILQMDPQLDQSQIGQIAHKNQTTNSFMNLKQTQSNSSFSIQNSPQINIKNNNYSNIIKNIFDEELSALSKDGSKFQDIDFQEDVRNNKQYLIDQFQNSSQLELTDEQKQNTQLIDDLFDKELEALKRMQKTDYSNWDEQTMMKKIELRGFRDNRLQNMFLNEIRALQNLKFYYLHYKKLIENSPQGQSVFDLENQFRNVQNRQQLFLLQNYYQLRKQVTYKRIKSETQYNQLDQELSLILNQQINSFDQLNQQKYNLDSNQYEKEMKYIFMQE